MPIAPPEIETVDAPHVACDGGEGALGHPRVYMQIDEAVGFVECKYCDKKFVLRGAGEEPGSSVDVGDTPGDRTDGDGLDARA